MTRETLKSFPEQFLWEPEVENANNLKKMPNLIALGMGGSHLAADLARTWAAYAERITVHSDYGLPAANEEQLKKSLIAAVSHSGNTEETLSGFNEAVSKNLAAAAISADGDLAALARQNSIPLVVIPDAGSEPRFATGHHFRAILKIMGEEKTLAETKELAQTLNPGELEEQGRELAEKIKNKIPVIYSSSKKSPVAQNWKIKFNETAKVPAFYGALPEINHNEMAGFGFSAAAGELSEKFFFIILRDKYDHPQNQKRAALTAEWLKKKGLAHSTVTLSGLNHWHKIFSAALLADWASFHLAELYGHDSEKVPPTEEFKKMMR